MRAAALVLALCAPAIACSGGQEPPPTPVKVEIPGTKLSFEMVPLKGGPVKVGSPDGEKGRKKDEAVRELALRPFQIGRREVTWAEFNAYFETKDPPGVDAVTRPTRATAYFGQVEIPGDFLEPKRPVTNVRWHSAIGYCWWLSIRTGRYFRLPTEAEWEYAARAGSSAAGPEPLDDHAWHKGNSEERTHVGAEKKPNAFGLFDMMGNLWEYGLEPYEPPSYGPVVRGGNWNSEGPELRFANRQPILMEWFEADPNRPRSVWWLTSNGVSQGFRLVCAADASDLAERQAYLPKLEVKILSGKEKVLRVGTSTSLAMEVKGEVRNGGDRALEEVEVLVHFLDKKGRPHLADLSGANKPGQATFSKCWPALAHSYADPAARAPLKPGETRPFALDIPQTFDDPATEVEKDKFAGRATNLKFAK